MTITITINTNNDAFRPHPDHEVNRLLAFVQNRVSANALRNLDGLKLMDANGNPVGRVEIVE